jgi:hypothetical protein
LHKYTVAVVGVIAAALAFTASTTTAALASAPSSEVTLSAMMSGQHKPRKPAPHKKTHAKARHHQAAPKKVAVANYTFASSPDFLNSDVADLRVSPFWHSGLDNGTNASYESSLDTYLSDIKANDVQDVLVAGDLVEGHWGVDAEDAGVFGPVTTTAQRAAATKLAASIYYKAWLERFRRNDLRAFPAVGDHDIGDNPWHAPSRTNLNAQDQKAVAEGWYTFKHDHVALFKKDWAERFTASGTRFAKHPRGPAHGTAYARMMSPQVLLVTVDEFNPSVNGVRFNLDPQQLAWFQDTLTWANRKQVKWIIVQGHMPVAGPVRYRHSSHAQVMHGTDSRFWKIMKAQHVDLYLCGEVHDTTAIRRDGITQVSHGGLFRYGEASYLLAKVHGDRLDMQAHEFDTRISDSVDRSRLWETDRRELPANMEYAAGSRVAGRMTITSDNRVVHRSGNLGPYHPSPADPILNVLSGE